MTKKTIKTRKELRKFGFVMTFPLAIIGGILLWKGKTTGLYFLIAATFFLLSGLLFPSILRPIEWLWMKIAEIISAVMTRVILTLTFYLVITPVGLLMRIFGQDLLQIKFKSSRDSYWVPVEKDGPCSRPNKPY